MAHKKQRAIIFEKEIRNRNCILFYKLAYRRKFGFVKLLFQIKFF